MARRKFVWYSVIALVLSVATGCGPSSDDTYYDSTYDDDSCTVPGGTYTMEFSDAGGDCPQESVNDVTAIKQDIEISYSRSCGTWTSSNTEQTDNGCTIEWNHRADLTSYGIENGRSTVEVSCSDGSSCSHEFNTYYEKR